MNDSIDRRHPNVVNLTEIPAISQQMGTRFGLTAKWLGHVAGAKNLGCIWYEIEPGRTAFPMHYHCANEEAIFILEGRGTLRIGDASVAVGPGDFLAFPAGPDHAHQLLNTGDTPIRYLCMATNLPVDVIGYPDSNKIAANANAPGKTFMDPPWTRGIFHSSASVDYYDGEKID